MVQRTKLHNRSQVAGWSSPVARQAHNLKVTGSNPVPATKYINKTKELNVERFACV